MRNLRWIVLAAALGAGAIGLWAYSPAPSASAMTGGGYDLTWNTIDGGGVTFASGGGYTLGGTIGQADAGRLSGGVFGLSGGFWSGIPGYDMFIPLVTK